MQLLDVAAAFFHKTEPWLMLPGVIISFGNGNLGSPIKTTENIVGLVINSDTGGLALSENYFFKSWAEAQAIAAIAGTPVGEFIRQFFDEALLYAAALGKPANASLYVRVVAKSVGYEDLVAQAEFLCDFAQNKITSVFVLHYPAAGYTPVMLDGADTALWDAAKAAQLFALDRIATKKTPITFYLKPNSIVSATVIRDLKTGAQNRVAIIVGDGYKTAAVVAGRLAQAPVHRNIGRVKDGAASLGSSKIGSVSTDDYAYLDDLHDKGYIVMRTHTDLAGYYVSDDPLYTNPANDDYSSIARRRTIDKAWRLAYVALQYELLDEVSITGAGEILPTYIKYLQGRVVQIIATAMTAKGELAADPTDKNDKGVKFSIPSGQNIVTQNTLNTTLSVRPFGYNKYINVDLGFSITTSTP